MNISFFEINNKKYEIKDLSKNQLISIITLCSKERKLRYCRNQHPKYGNLPRNFTLAEAKRFFACCDHEKAKMAFLISASLGLRCSEALQLRREDLMLERGLARIETLKSGTTNFLPLPPLLKQLLIRYLKCHAEAIALCKGHIIYSKQNKSGRLSSGWLRKYFREVCTKAGLTMVYDKSKDGRPLYRLTIHSFRHMVGHYVYALSSDLVATQKYLRHVDQRATLTYTNMGFDKLREVGTDYNDALSNAILPKSENLAYAVPVVTP